MRNTEIDLTTVMLIGQLLWQFIKFWSPILLVILGVFAYVGVVNLIRVFYG